MGLSEDDDDPVPPGGQLTESCPFCEGRRSYSSLGAEAIWTAPSGHTIRYTPDGAKYDTCPRDPASRNT